MKRLRSQSAKSDLCTGWDVGRKTGTRVMEGLVGEAPEVAGKPFFLLLRATAACTLLGTWQLLKSRG